METIQVVCNHFSHRDEKRWNSEIEKEKEGLKIQLVYCNRSKTGGKRRKRKRRKGKGKEEEKKGKEEK